MRGTPSFLCYASKTMVVGGTLLSKDSGNYINGCIEMVLKNPKCPFFDGIVNPPRIGSSDETNKVIFLTENCYLVPTDTLAIKPYLPVAQESFKFKDILFSLNSNQVWRQPRLIDDLSCNVVLISNPIYAQLSFGVALDLRMISFFSRFQHTFIFHLYCPIGVVFLKNL